MLHKTYIIIYKINNYMRASFFCRNTAIAAAFRIKCKIILVTLFNLR